MLGNPIDYTILHIEDDDVDAIIIARALKKSLGVHIEIVRSTTMLEAQIALRAQSFDSVLLDLGLPDASTIEADLKQIQDQQSIPIIVLTGNEHPDLICRAFSCGCEDILSKSSVDLATLGSVLNRAIERADAVRAQKSQEMEIGSFFHSYFDASDDGFIMMLENGDIIAKNDAAKRLWEAENIDEYKEVLGHVSRGSRHSAMLLKFETGMEVHDVLITPVAHHQTSLLVVSIRNVTPKSHSIDVPVRPGRDWETSRTIN